MTRAEMKNKAKDGPLKSGPFFYALAWNNLPIHCELYMYTESQFDTCTIRIINILTALSRNQLNDDYCSNRFPFLPFF